MTALSRVAEAENRWDGPIPQHELDAALGRNAALLEAEGNHAFYRRMAERQRETIATRRADGSYYEALANDLALYEERMAWWGAQLAARSTRT